MKTSRRIRSRKVARVNRLLEQGYRQDWIATKCNLTKQEIWLIANRTLAIRANSRPKASGGKVPQTVEIVRCRECGAKIYETPCRACTLRQGMGV